MRFIDLDDVDWSDPPAFDPDVDRLVVGVASRRVPAQAQNYLETLTFTYAPDAPGISWVDAEPSDDLFDGGPAHVLLDVLSLAGEGSVQDGLLVESLAYSMLLAGRDFLSWRAANPAGDPPEGDDPVLVSRDGDTLYVELNRPRRHNAFGRSMRDALLDALDIAAWDDSCRTVVLTGAGPSFCAGGDLDEFGSAPDVVSAHSVRLTRSAGRGVHQLRSKVRPILHGACIGAGIEVPAFADHVTARRDAYFVLPELSFGLIPGAGGTVSMTRRIGRWRTAYMALTGRTVAAQQALDWGLVDELI